MALMVMKNANLALRFLLELCVLFALGYWGFQTGQTMIVRIVLGIGAPVVAIVIWALLGAPKAPWQLKGASRFLLEVVFFGLPAVALFVVGQHILGIAFALVFVLNTILIYMWSQ
ncbi:MAG TPA: YrdB family protein [Ktedonobacteraceae bacterium]|nr:YrdB family protein [Ktedonobacteraceae bacterium]